MDTEKQRRRRRDGVRLTESGNARSEQLLVVPTESLTNRQRLLGELLSGSECRRTGWFLDMKYQTCFFFLSCFFFVFVAMYDQQVLYIRTLPVIHTDKQCVWRVSM